MAKKAAFFTLGCKTNQYETEAMASAFRSRGYETVDFDEIADIYIINTCTVTHQGDRKSRQVIRRAVRKNPDAVIGVTGCYAQTSPGEVLDIPGVDLVIGTRDKSRIVELVEEAEKSPEPVNTVSDVMTYREFEDLPILDYENRTRAFVKIQEGCSNFCTYCIIPYARGPLRSRAPENVLAEVRKLISQGFGEIVLTGIHIGAYGAGLAEQTDLADLVVQIALTPGIKRLRLGSVEPLDITPRLIDAVAQIKTVCRHLHIPLQSGDDDILKMMNRKYTTFEFSRLVGAIRGQIPEIAVTTDVITGFPGETDEHFENTYEFIKDVGFSRTHVFKYSPRKGTPAAGFPGQVTAEAKDLRSRRLIALDRENQKKFAARFIGSNLEVLAEEMADRDNDLWEGLTDTYIRVMFKSSDDIRGKLVDVRAVKLKGANLLARMRI
ncbi:tRNA (N(6)-L-threonylcarbamoyladenosine(37)-C(2))-methylthiotransferase MtaB [Phosphitispora fastidiosa]|uniref:tRNA (N(6)-L-threonylcarbamoyladenosine(37)-C(2))- methylthiotransferase MtaB n=1 Tax=Phosphitispora fastidiosa TaxID=2837202 RepID=UPI001E32C301|nr:tRNA (N(6)-L-threonylcarbamoyladenosine(37)-C(2))-methylthiotransferase MtaB [Phosphitispora fastidiosa]MBU7005902.1 threonylcarbamoyladenosine tRNA methylthiotransferase MtaB [Phosphitispora fastidiosa]